VIGHVVASDMTKDDWPAVRDGIRRRIVASMGTGPDESRPPEHEEIERYEKYGLEHIRLRYHVVADLWNEAIAVLPGSGDQAQPAPAVLTIHGTNGKVGKAGMLDPDGTPDRAYGVELARRGYVTFCPDQFGFGAWLDEAEQQDVIAGFYRRWPDWSLDGLRAGEQSRAIDLLESFDFVDSAPGFGVMGNSLGGRAAMHLAALDERVTAAVPSCGVSPVCSNAYRLVRRDRLLCPALSEQPEVDGKAIWDYHEMLALCAPRAVLLLEPFNDPYNPDIGPVFECVDSARRVYELLGEPEKLAIYVHGDGHNTAPAVREIAYRWFDRFLKGREVRP